MTAQTNTQNLMTQWGKGKAPATPETMDELIAIRDLFIELYEATGIAAIDQEEMMKWLDENGYQQYPGMLGRYMVKNATEMLKIEA
jgi:hypothetical protein